MISVFLFYQYFVPDGTLQIRLRLRRARKSVVSKLFIGM